MDRTANQHPEPPATGTDYLRRTVGVAIGLSPTALLVASAVVGGIGRMGRPAALGLAVAGLLVGAFNAHLSFVRPWLYRRRRGSLEGYRFASGVPLFGTLLVVAAGLLGFGDWPTALVGMLASAIDTGGLPWFLIATWHDELLWDA